MSNLNRKEEAIEAQSESIEIWAQLRKDLSSASEAIREQAGVWMNRGNVLQGQNDWAGSLEAFARCAALLDELGPADRLTLTERRLKIRSLLNLAQTQYTLKRREEAYPVAAQAVHMGAAIGEGTPS